MSDHPSPCRHESTQWTHRTWSSPSEFIGQLSCIEDGLHTVELAGGQHLDLWLRGRPLDPAHTAVAVVFNGAVTQRASKSPPFLSGARLTRDVRLPMISVADPTLVMDQELMLAWYIGGQGVPAQSAIRNILGAMVEVSGNDFWLVGGSGGAFAALDAAQYVGRGCNVLAWNPQTDVLEYSPRLVKHFLATAYPNLVGVLDQDDWKDRAREVLSSDGARWHHLESFRSGFSFDRLLCLQNWNDWHVRSHMVPWLNSIAGVHELWPDLHGTDDDHVVWLTEAGEGHAPPSGESIKLLLSELVNGQDSVRAIASWHQQAGLFPRANARHYVKDLRPFRSAIHRGVTFEYTDGESITPTSEQLDAEFGGMRFGYERWHRGKVIATTIAPLGSRYVAQQDDLEWDYVRVRVLDGFDHELYAVNFVNQQRGVS